MKKCPILTRILTNMVPATAIAVTLFVLLMALTASIVQVLWSDASIILGLFIVIPIYITVFAIVTWTIMLYKK